VTIVNFNVALPASNVPPGNIDGDDDVLYYYNFSTGDYDGLNNYFSSVNWDELFTTVVDNQINGLIEGGNLGSFTVM